MQYTLLMRAAARRLRGGAPDHFGAESRLIKPRPCPVAFAPPAGAAAMPETIDSALRQARPRPAPGQAAMPETIDSALRQARARLAPGEAELLLAHVLGRDQGWLYAHGTDPLAPADAERFEAMVARRAGGEPVAYLTGRRGFWTLDLQV